jgi:hypothetical protein
MYYFPSVLFITNVYLYTSIRIRNINVAYQNDKKMSFILLYAGNPFDIKDPLGHKGKSAGNGLLNLRVLLPHCLVCRAALAPPVCCALAAALPVPGRRRYVQFLSDSVGASAN